MKSADCQGTNNIRIAVREPGGDDLEAFGALIEDIKSCFPIEADGLDLGLVYDYDQLNTYGKIIMDKICPKRCGRKGGLSREERIRETLLFKEKCKRGEGDKYSFIFWALMVFTVDKAEKEQRLSRICDFSLFLGLPEAEMMNIVKLAQLVSRKLWKGKGCKNGKKDQISVRNE